MSYLQSNIWRAASQYDTKCAIFTTCRHRLVCETSPTRHGRPCADQRCTQFQPQRMRAMPSTCRSQHLLLTSDSNLVRRFVVLTIAPNECHTKHRVQGTRHGKPKSRNQFRAPSTSPQCKEPTVPKGQGQGRDPGAGLHTPTLCDNRTPIIQPLQHMEYEYAKHLKIGHDSCLSQLFLFTNMPVQSSYISFGGILTASDAKLRTITEHLRHGHQLKCL